MERLLTVVLVVVAVFRHAISVKSRMQHFSELSTRRGVFVHIEDGADYASGNTFGVANTTGREPFFGSFAGDGIMLRDFRNA